MDINEIPHSNGRFYCSLFLKSKLPILVEFATEHIFQLENNFSIRCLFMAWTFSISVDLDRYKCYKRRDKSLTRDV